MTTATQQNSSSRLGVAISGTIDEPLRYFLYGPEGVGKTTLASYSEAPIIFDAENGSGNLNVTRYSFRDGQHGHVPRTLEELHSGIKDLRESKHNLRTLIIDSMSSLESLIWSSVCQSNGKDSIESFGYGKGYTLAAGELENITERLDELRCERGMTIILIGHSMVKTHKNPVGEDYDRYRVDMHEKSAAHLRKFCDIVAFCNFEEGASASDDGSRAKGFSTGRRLLNLERRATWDAKTRIPLPSVIPMAIGNSWKPLADAVEAGRNTSAKDLVAAIKQELKRLDNEELSKKVLASVEAASDDIPTLSQYLNKLKDKQ